MSLAIIVKADIKQITRYLSDVQKKQIPFAAKNALNDTAFQAQKAEKKQLPQKLDRPTPFTVRGIRVKRATKSKLVSSVYVNPVVWEYLKYQVDGGLRKPQGRFLPIPVNIKLNKYGNIKGKKRGPKGKNQIVEKVGNTLGVFQQLSKGRRRLLIAYVKQARYKKRFPFYKIARKLGENRFKINFEKQMALALASAK